MSSSNALLQKRLDIHDRKQFEIKLEYQPSGSDPTSKYLVDAYIFLPASLNVDAETYPRTQFYADIHNYVRLKTPLMSPHELLDADYSPLVRFESLTRGLTPQSRSELVYQAKMLSCVMRGVLRQFVRDVAQLSDADTRPDTVQVLREHIEETQRLSREVVSRFRQSHALLEKRTDIEAATRVSLRLVDEYLSLSVEQRFRKAVADMEELPKTPPFDELRKSLMQDVVAEDSYRKHNQLKSVVSPTGDNEEYLYRIGVLKKFCMNILFLTVRRDQTRAGWEEVLFAMAAGLAMAFATAVAFWAQLRFPQVSLNFFLILVVGYMMKDRIKEGLRRIFAKAASRAFFDRQTQILDPVTKESVGLLKEKVDYGRAVKVPREITEARLTDELAAVSQGELSEMVIRYQKQVYLESKMLPKMAGGIVSGVTDIIRLNVDRLLRDMDDPEAALEYIDLEDFTVGRVKAAKSYLVDVAFRFAVDDADTRRTSLQLVRLVLDRNGLKRMIRVEPPSGA